MSTAEQVARAFIGADALAGIGYEHDLEVATKAIEFDRAVHDGVEVSVIPRSAMTTPEGVTYWPIFQWEAARGDVHHVGGDDLVRLEVGVKVVLPSGKEHEVRLVPSTATDEGDGTGNVFIYEDDDAVAHIAWKDDSND